MIDINELRRRVRTGDHNPISNGSAPPATLPAGPAPNYKPWLWGIGLLLLALQLRTCLTSDGTSGPVTPSLQVSPAYSVQWFSSPLDYMVAPKPGIERVNMRSGPGGEYPSLLMLPRGSVISGEGSATAADGSLWISVRTADGAKGFIADKVLQLGTPIGTGVDEANRPSFACDGDLSWVERTICGDASLAAKDRQVASRYHEILGSLSGDSRQRAVNVQRNWLEERDRCGGSGDIPACLNSAYEGRISILQEWSPPTPSTPFVQPGNSDRSLPQRRSQQDQATGIDPADADSSSLVSCVLPSGAELRMSEEECRESAGVILSER